MPRRSTAHDAATGFVLRSTLRLALRQGDLAAAGRAVARLRVDGAGVAPAELVAARFARVERASRDLAARDAVAPPSPRRGPAPSIVRAITLAALGLFALLALVPSASQDDGPPPAAAPAGVLERPAPESRGRSTATLPPIALASPEPTPTAAPAPEPTAPPAAPTVATAAPVVRLGVPGGVAGGVPGGAAGGVPGGTVGGTGSGKPVATSPPTPMPVALLVPSALPKGFSRLTLMVLDGVTGQPVSGACVVLGTSSCGPSKPQTNELGLWWLDYPSGSARHWDISLVDPRYRSLTTRVITGAVDQTVRVSLGR